MVALYPLLLAGLSLLGLSSLWDLSVYERAQMALSEAESASDPLINGGELSAADDLVSLSHYKNAPTQVYFRTSALLREEALKASDLNRKIELFCEALQVMGRARRHFPRSAYVLASWANLRQLLGEISCQGSKRGESYQSAIQEALLLAPYEPSVVRAAHSMYRYAGNREKTLATLALLLQIERDAKDDEVFSMLSELKTPGEALKVIPRRFPQVRQAYPFLTALSDESLSERNNWRTAADQILIEAIDNTELEYSSEALAPRHYEEILSKILTLHLSPAASERYLSALSRYYEDRGEKQLKKLFGELSKLSPLPHVVTVQNGDTRAEKTPLVNWGTRDGSTVSLDHYFRTIGFFVPNESKVSQIVLKSYLWNSKLDLTHIKILVSNDQEKWMDISKDTISSCERALNRLFCFFSPADADFRFWKIHYFRPQRTGYFRNEESQILSVFGRKESA